MPIPPLRGISAGGDPVNVVLLVLDTQRVKNMSCYGYDKPTTPSAERVASEGVLFENHFVPGCWTLPSHTSMFTGLYPFTHRADMEHAYLDGAYPTWAEMAHALGYLTAAFNPNTWIRAAEADRGFHVIDSCQKPSNYSKGSEFVIERFADWLRVYRDDKRPFFAFLNIGDPHLVCRPAEPYLSKFLPEGVTADEAMELNQNPHHRVGGMQEWTERDWAILQGLNDGCVATADHRVGLLDNLLRGEGLADKTLLIITSDHGDVYHEHEPLMAHVMNVYDACIHTPLIMRLPGVFEGGRRVQSLVQAVDLLPTFLDLIGAPFDGPLADIQGASLRPALQGEIREFVYAEDPYPWNELERYKSYEEARDLRRFHRFLRTVRDHEYKYIYSSRGEDELYRVSEDPDEQTNLIDERPEVAAVMLDKMEKWLWNMPVRWPRPALNTSPIKPVTDDSLRRMELWRGAVPRIRKPS